MKVCIRSAGLAARDLIKKKSREAALVVDQVFDYQIYILDVVVQVVAKSAVRDNPQ